MPKPPIDQLLTAKQQRFVKEYLVDMNATQAAARAGYSARTARAIGRENLQKPQVKAAIDGELAKINAKVGTTAEATLAEITRLAMFDPADLVKVRRPSDIAKLPAEVRRAIVGWRYTAHGFSIELAKQGALEMLAKHHGLYAADNKQRGDLTLKVTDEQLAARVKRLQDKLNGPDKG